MIIYNEKKIELDWVRNLPEGNYHVTDTFFREPSIVEKSELSNYILNLNDKINQSGGHVIKEEILIRGPMREIK